MLPLRQKKIYKSTYGLYYYDNNNNKYYLTTDGETIKKRMN